MTAAPNFAYALLARGCAGRPSPARSTCRRCAWRCRAPNRSTPPTSTLSSTRASRSGCARRRSCRPTAWPRPRSRCRSPMRRRPGGRRGRRRPAGRVHRAVPATTGKPRRLATLGPLLAGLEARVVDEDGALLPARGVGVIELRGDPVTRGLPHDGAAHRRPRTTRLVRHRRRGLPHRGGHVVVCGRVKDVIIMGGRNIYPTDIERAAGRVEGVRPGNAVAVRLDAGRPREIVRGRGGVQRLPRTRRGAPHRARGRPRGGRRGGRAAAHGRGARAGHASRRPRRASCAAGLPCRSSARFQLRPASYCGYTGTRRHPGNGISTPRSTNTR